MPYFVQDPAVSMYAVLLPAADYGRDGLLEAGSACQTADAQSWCVDVQEFDLKCQCRRKSKSQLLNRQACAEIVMQVLCANAAQ